MYTCRNFSKEDIIAKHNAIVALEVYLKLHINFIGSQNPKTYIYEITDENDDMLVIAEFEDFYALYVPIQSGNKALEHFLGCMERKSKKVVVFLKTTFDFIQKMEERYQWEVELW